MAKKMVAPLTFTVVTLREAMSLGIYVEAEAHFSSHIILGHVAGTKPAKAVVYMDLKTHMRNDGRKQITTNAIFVVNWRSSGRKNVGKGYGRQIMEFFLKTYSSTAERVLHKVANCNEYSENLLASLGYQGHYDDEVDCLDYTKSIGLST